MPSICQEDGQGRKEEVESHHQKLTHLHTKPNHKNKTKSNSYVIKKKANGKVVAHKVGKMKEERGWNQPIWVPKEVIINMKGPQMVWVQKAT
jgi:hypothetical protein